MFFCSLISDAATVISCCCPHLRQLLFFSIASSRILNFFWWHTCLDARESVRMMTVSRYKSETQISLAAQEKRQCRKNMNRCKVLEEDRWILRSMLSTFTLVEQPQELHREWGRQFLKHELTGPLEKTVPPDDTILAYKFLRMSTSHFVWREVSWIPLTPLPVTLGWSNSSA